MPAPINDNAGVRPRYLNPKSPVNTGLMAPPRREVFAPVGGYQGVRARHLSPRSRASPQPVARQDQPRAHFKGADLHVTLASSLGYGNVPGRYLDGVLREPAHDSPRALVEAHRREDDIAKEANWHSPGGRAPKTTFDELSGEYKPAEQFVKRRSNASSSVGDYIRNGTPIKHCSMSDEPVVLPRRARSPVTWRSGGVTEKDFRKLERDSRRRRVYASEEARVAELAERHLGAVRPKAFVPRVAMLAPSYRLPEYDVPAGDEPARN
jgi:hypothetical protein